MAAALVKGVDAGSLLLLASPCLLAPVTLSGLFGGTNLFRD